MKAKTLKASLSNMATSLLVLMLSLCTLYLPGCAGGGSSGTGTTIVKGSILTEDDQPVANAVVTVEGTTDSTVTDEDGKFSLDSTRDGDKLTLVVEVSGQASSLDITDVPEETDQIELAASLASDNQTLTVDTIKFVNSRRGGGNGSGGQDGEGEGPPIASPTPIIAPTPIISESIDEPLGDEGDEPDPVPTATSTPVPTPTPSSTPGLTPEPTPASTATPLPL